MKNIFTNFAVLAKEEPLGNIEGLPGGYDPGKDSITTATDTLTRIFSNVFSFFTILAGLMFVLYFLLGGLQWVTSSGEADKVEKAKKEMTNAAIGMIIVVAAYGIIFVVGRVLGMEILNPADYIINFLGPKGATP